MRRKLILILLAIAIGALLAPLLFTVAWSRGAQGYFESGRCLCGHASFTYLMQGGYYHYSPGHGMGPHRVFNLKRGANDWEVLSHDGNAVARLRFQDGDLLERWSGSTNWVRHRRVYNVWRVWGAALLAKSGTHQATCINNLKQIGLAFRTWALDHGDKFPFNLSASEGGTLEFCRADKTGFDSNAALHFQVMSNELSTPVLLVCPQGPAKAAKDFRSLKAKHVSYLLRSGEVVSPQHPTNVLAVCPIDGSILYCDGTVKVKK